jgi:predicted branched-subunit amino acid permease
MTRPSGLRPDPLPDPPLQPAWRVRHHEFLRGARDMAALGPGTAAWGLVTGVAMVKAGLGVPLALLMTFTVFAGSAQLAALPLMTAQAPLWVIWTAAACVNLRFIVFSLQWRPYLMHLPLLQRVAYSYFGTDMAYVLFMKRFPEPAPGGGQREYLGGLMTVNWLSWQLPSVAGILLVDAVPPQWSLGFAGVLALLGLGLSLVSDRAMALAAAVAGAAAVATVALPLKLNIVVAIAAAVAAGSIFDAIGSARRRPAVEGLAPAAVARKARPPR